MKKNHPYKMMENSDLWMVVSRTIKELQKNGDIAEQTPHEYVVGYICQKLKENGFQKFELRADANVRYIVELSPAKAG